MEAYLDGDEYSVETLDDRVVGVTGKHLGPPPYFVETGHDFPAPLADGEREAIGASAVAALRALGLAWGPAHVELRYSATGPQVIEVNPRLAGGMIPRTVQEACGVDMVFQTVARAAGQPVDLTPTRDLAASIRFLVAPNAGRLVEINGVEQARQLPGVVEVGLTREVGQDLVVRHSFQDRLGYVIASAPDGTGAARAAEAGLRTLQARIAPTWYVTEGSLRS